MAIEYKEFKFFSDIDKLEIDCLAVFPDVKIRGIVQLVHGMCEHKERYRDFMSYLASKGYACVIHDHRGHGKSVETDADLGYFYDGGYEAMVEDIHQLTEMVKEYADSDVPYILLGHSMGSLAVRCYIKKYDSDIDKLIVAGSPSKVYGMKVGKLIADILGKIKGGHNHSKILDNLVINSRYEKRFQNEGVVHAWICSDRKVVDKYNDDPYCNFFFSIQGYQNLLSLTMETYNRKGWKVNKPSLPILFVSGKEDPCAISPVDFGKTVHFLKDIGYKNVRARLYKGLRHEILNETGKKRVYRDIYEFIAEE